jgi:hypothetical protein
MFQKISFSVSVLLGLLTFAFLAIGIYVRNKKNGQSSSGKATGVRYFLLATLSFGFAWFMLESADIGFSWNTVGDSVIGAMIFLIMLIVGETVHMMSSRFLVTKDSLSPLDQFIKIFNLITKKSSDEQDSDVDDTHKN